MDKLKIRLRLDGRGERTVTIDKDQCIIGRLPDCDLYLAFSEVSRYHARFWKNDIGNWFIEDLGSTNGTQLNDRPVLTPQTLKNGDLVQVAHISMSVILPEITSAPLEHTGPPTEGMTIFRNAQELRQEWIQAEDLTDTLASQQTSINRLKDLVDIAKALSSSESIESLFHSVQQVVFREIKTVDRIALLIDMQGTGKLEMTNSAVRNNNQYIPNDATWISQYICQKVFAEKIVVKTADAQMDQRFEGEQSILVKGIRSAIAVPLWDENKVVGVLYADAKLPAGRWNKSEDEDLRFFSTLGNLVAASVQRWLLTEKLKKEEGIRQKLERYHSPAVVQHLMNVAHLNQGRIQPAEIDISILFADLVGFTALSERLPPSQVAQLLNVFFEEMLHEIFTVGGTLDKFIGDCIMAFFGAPEPQVDHAQRALLAAKGMLSRLERLNQTRFHREPLKLRIAINSGRAVVGDVGSPQRMEYTVLGGTVNLASRMEQICAPGEFVISEATYHKLADKKGLIDLGDFKFKGIDRSIRIFGPQKS